MNDHGWFKIHRVIFNSSLWMKRPEDLKLAIALIGMANVEDKEFFNKWAQNRIPVKRGELITSLNHLATACNMSVRNIRTSLKNLINDRFCELIQPDTASTQHQKKQYTHIRIIKYDEYQSRYYNDEIESRSEKSEQPDTAPHRKLTTTKEERIKKKEELELYPKLGVINNSSHSETVIDPPISEKSARQQTKKSSKKISDIDSWKYNEKHFQTAICRQIDIDLEERKFRNYAKNRKDPYRDLDAAFDNWLISPFQDKNLSKFEKSARVLQRWVEEKDKPRVGYPGDFSDAKKSYDFSD